MIERVLFYAWLAQVAKEGIDFESTYKEACLKAYERGYPELSSIAYELDGQFTKTGRLAVFG